MQSETSQAARAHVAPAGIWMQTRRQELCEKETVIAAVGPAPASRSAATARSPPLVKEDSDAPADGSTIILPPHIDELRMRSAPQLVDSHSLNLLYKLKYRYQHDCRLPTAALSLNGLVDSRI